MRRGDVGEDAGCRSQAVVVGEAGLVDEQNRRVVASLGRTLPFCNIAHTIQGHSATGSAATQCRRFLRNGETAYRANEPSVADGSRRVFNHGGGAEKGIAGAQLRFDGDTQDGSGCGVDRDHAVIGGRLVVCL